MSNENEYTDQEADRLYSKTLLRQGDSYYQAKRYWDALLAYSRALRLIPNDVDAFVGSGNCLRELQREEEALSYYDKAIALNPQNISTYVAKADIYASIRKHEDALALYMMAGEVYLKQKCFEQVLEVYTKAIQLNPHFPLAHTGKGHALYALNRGTDALK